MNAKIEIGPFSHSHQEGYKIAQFLTDKARFKEKCIVKYCITLLGNSDNQSGLFTLYTSEFKNRHLGRVKALSG